MTSALRRRFPVLANLYVGQVTFGAAFALLAASLWRHHSGAAPLGPLSLAARWVGVVVLALTFVLYLQNVHRFGLVPDYSLKCRFCNGPVNRYSEFCEHCGADLIAEEKLIHCAKCGVELYEGTKHCPECGARVASSQNPKKKSKTPRDRESGAGWSAPIDATTGVPPGDDRR